MCMWIFAASETFNSIHKSFDLETSCSVGADIVGVRVSRHAYDPNPTQVMLTGLGGVDGLKPPVRAHVL